MPVCRCAAVIVLVALAAGCLPFRGERSARSILQSYNPFGLRTAVTRDKFVLRTVLLERPTGDPYLSEQLWASTMKPLPPETAALLAENGLRVATFPSNPPAELLERINAGDGTVRPNETTANLGETKVLPVNGPVSHATFLAINDIGATPVEQEFPDAHFGFAITGTATDTGKLKLVFEPKVQHGQKHGWLRPTSDGTGFVRLDQKDSARFARLQFDVTVRPGEYLIIGPTERPAQKVGGAWFVADANGGSRMRVLIVRAWRGPEAPAEPLPGRKLADSAKP